MSEDSEGDDEDIPGDHLNPDDFLAADTVRESFDETAMDPILSANLFEVMKYQIEREGVSRATYNNFCQVN